jgi:hypothetical protein
VLAAIKLATVTIIVIQLIRLKIISIFFSYKG